MDAQQLRNILESCLLVAGKAMTLPQLEVLFEEDIDRPERNEIKDALLALQQEYEGRGIELVEVASGWRLQSSATMEHWVGRLFEEKSPRYSRALLETLVLIAYRQPITRGEIEEVRGVAVSSNIMRTLQERDWIKEMGFKDVPGRPTLWGTSKEFLDYFNLKRLDELPTLAEARDLAEIDAALAAEVGLVDGVTDSVAANDSRGESEGDDSGEAENADEAGLDENSDELKDVTVSMDSDDGEPLETSGLQSLEGEIAEGSDSESVAVKSSDGSDSEVVEGVSADGEPSERHDSTSIEGEIATGSQVADLLNEDEPADESQGSSDLVSLAASLNKSSQPRVEPDLGAMVDDFGETHENADDNGLVEDESSVDNDEKSSSIEAMEISAHDIDVGEWKEPDAKTHRKDNALGVEDDEITSDDHATELGDHDLGRQGVDANIGNSGTDTPQADPVHDVVDTQREQAESDLRRVIDDFAEEHRQQIDVDNELRSRHSGPVDVAAGTSADSRVSESETGLGFSEANGLVTGRSQSPIAQDLTETDDMPGADTDAQSDGPESKHNPGSSGEP